jgi:transcription-repair coupling factor (superfamily II helicase)
LLSKDVKFNKVGLIIIDEEQQFGVADKEKLKELKTSAHILTLSATPIPRTLNLSLSNVRDISIIATPPLPPPHQNHYPTIFCQHNLRQSRRKENAAANEYLYNKVGLINEQNTAGTNLPQSVTPSYTASYPRRHCPNHHEFDAAN